MKIVLTENKHAALLSEYHLANAERFQRWNPVVPEGHHTVSAWQKRLKERASQQVLGNIAHFIGLDDAGTHIIGACSLTNIIYDPAYFCFMGYSVAGQYEGQGLMTGIVEHSLDYAFSELGLNRVMASYMPENERSGRLLEKLGFQKEGYAKRYLKINGEWADHVMTSRLVDSERL